MAKKASKLSDIGPQLKEFGEAVLRETVLLADARVKEGSPKDTARFINSWMIGENNESGQPAPPGDYGNDIPPPTAINFSLDNFELGNTYSIHNNLEYAEPVAYGTNLPPSWGGKYQVGNPNLKPARNQGVEPGFPDLAEKEAQAFLDQAARKFLKKFF